MSLATRSLDLTRDVVRELGMVVPRTVAGLSESTGWVPATPRGVRQFGEVMLDELVLSGFSLLDRGPAAVRPLSECAAAAEELSALGIDGAHADPEPLRVQTIRQRRIGRLAYERMTYKHDPALPKTLEDDGLGGPARQGGGASVPAPRRPETLAGVGARRGPGRHRRPGAVADRTHTSPAGFQ